MLALLQVYVNYTNVSFSSLQSHWLGVYDADYRKLQNQARFIREIMDGKLVVSRKKKQIIVAELRDKKYEAFPKGQDAKKTKSEDDEEGNAEEGNEDLETDTAANDYDYLLSVSFCCNIGQESKSLIINRCPSGRLLKSA